MRPDNKVGATKWNPGEYEGKLIGKYWKILKEWQAGKHQGQLTNILKQMLRESGGKND